MKRSILNKELWYSTIAILTYFPKAFAAPKVDGNAFYIKQVQNALKQRIHTVTEDSKRVWGTITVAQMLHYLSLSDGLC